MIAAWSAEAVAASISGSSIRGRAVAGAWFADGSAGTAVGD